MNLLYVCNFGRRTGYARAAEDYLTAFSRLGVEFSIEPILDIELELLGPRAQALLPHVVGWEKKTQATPTHVIIHAQPHVCVQLAPRMRNQYPGVPVVAYTTWETWPAPAELCRQLEDAVDLVIVPSGFCFDTFEEGGFPRHRLRKVPHCFDPAAWATSSNVPRPQATAFEFVSVLSWNARKNPFGLLRAYLTEFRADESVSLSLLAPWHIERDIETIKLGAQLPDYPSVHVENSVDDAAYEQFLRSGDCYVTATRGEGWDLPAFDAATMLLPVIAPDIGGGSIDFLSKYPGYRRYTGQLTPAILPLTDRGEGVRLIGPSFMDGRQLWGEPDLNQLRKIMRRVFEEWKEGHLPQHASHPNPRLQLEQLFSYDVVGKKYRDVLQNFILERKEL